MAVFVWWTAMKRRPGEWRQLLAASAPSSNEEDVEDGVFVLNFSRPVCRRAMEKWRMASSGWCIGGWS